MPELTAFGTPILRSVKGSDCRKQFMPQYGFELDKETGSMKVVKKDPIDLDALIQSYEHECGMEQAKLMISRGLARPEDFAAKSGYVDVSNLPDNINDAYQEQMAAKKAAGAHGINLSQFKSDKDITDYVNKKVQEALAAAKAEAAKTDNSKEAQ